MLRPEVGKTRVERCKPALEGWYSVCCLPKIYLSDDTWPPDKPICPKSTFLMTPGFQTNAPICPKLPFWWHLASKQSHPSAQNLPFWWHTCTWGHGDQDSSHGIPDKAYVTDSDGDSFASGAIHFNNNHVHLSCAHHFNNNHVHLSCAPQRPERSHDTY